ncbi:MAG: tRNA (adenine(22)-N(1))-methyltransferase TrmK [Zavarzinella sp.]|nr:tRNA (adenine(22)-N(1))-methyltransferase TrmK [Zavarzinella sp.]
MRLHRPPVLAVVAALAFSLSAAAQGKKAPATVKLLIPETPTKVTLKVEGKELETNDKAAKEGVRVLVTPELEPGKTYAYKVEAVIEPNNYTKIERTREVTFKAGETVEVDLRKKDDKLPDNVVIRWVPTPKVVVDDMCKLAKVGKDDVVMDPGCGDAIMIITAVKDFNAKHGIGTDLFEDKVKISQENVEKAGLKDKITIKQGNALKLTADDLKDVTVVMLYMGNDLNIRLRPILWEHLKPGARIVSHRFIMGDWKPDQSITVTREGDYGVEDFHLHVWTVTGKEKTGDYPKADPSKLNDQ